MMTSRFSGLAGLAFCLLAAAVHAQSPAEQLDLARKAIAAGKFQDAVSALEAVTNNPGNDEATLLALYELQGITWTGLKKATPAKSAFQKLLLLAPAAKLTGKQPPKVTQAFNEAKKFMASHAPAGLLMEQLTPEITAGKVTAILIAVENDLLRLGKKVRVHLRIDGAAWTVSEIDPLELSRADVSGKVVEYWAELMGDKGAVLRKLGSEAEPIVDLIPGAKIPPRGEVAKAGPKDSGAKDAPKADGKPNLTPDPVKDPGPEIVQKPGKPLKVPIGSIVLAGAAVAAGGAAVAFGLSANGARAQFTNATTNSAGAVTGITRAQALDLEKQAGTNAIVANSLIGGAIGLALAAGAVFILGQGGTP